METKELKLFKQTVVFDESDCIFIQPLCDFFKINSENQTRTIKNDVILEKESTKKSNKIIFGNNIPRVCLSKKGFIRWIQLINPNTVNPNLKDKLIVYQTFVFDYIYGQALVPNIRRQHAIDLRKKELNKQINVLMKEHKDLEKERKQLTITNYAQLGLSFPEVNHSDDNLKPFAEKYSSE